MKAFDFPIDEDCLKNVFGKDIPTWNSYSALFSDKALFRPNVLQPDL